MISDFHLHTFVSDGDLDPSAVLAEASARGITHLAITDHDTLGAYAWEAGRVFAEARRLGLELTVGIEMDAHLDGLEVHVLGLELERQDRPLGAHLGRVSEARGLRARREIDIVNALLGEGTIRPSEIFVPGRETLMKPHFIHPILEKGLFPTYEDANAWYRENVKAGVQVPKPSLGEAIQLIHGAGGWAALAHPGYYEKAGLRLEGRLSELRGLGLDGIELHYPYHACSPRLFSAADETGLVERLGLEAASAGLRVTRGSDAHTRADFQKVYGSPGG